MGKNIKGYKPWAGRFRKKTDNLVDEFNASISFDRRLFRHDIRGSIAHAKMLAKVKVITQGEAKKIVSGLKAIEREITSGKFVLTPDMEDIHMAIERRLIEKTGPLGGKLHTGRSRNDQVALDMRLFLRDEIKEIQGLIRTLKETVVDIARTNLDVIIPGYTHLQRAQPLLFSHHLLAYYEMFKRDGERFSDCLKRVNVMPLGAGALAGSPYPLDRDFVAKELRFSQVSENSLDAVSDRDFSLEFLGCASIMMMHLSRMSEELIVWSSQEFGFIELSDAFATGSSVMPQKKNPDIPELIRGKTGRVYGDLISLLTTMKAIPLAYNKDMQEDKEPLFNATDTVKGCLGVISPMLKTIRIDRKRMLSAAKDGFLTATDAADYLVQKGLPFREAHHITGRVVAWCIDKGRRLEELEIKEWRRFSDCFDNDIRDWITVKASINSRDVRGGTALKRVKKRIKEIEAELEKAE